MKLAKVVFFFDDNFDSFKALVERTDYVCGFNNHNFDDNLCNAHGLTIPKEKSKDVLQMIWAALGLGCEFKRGTHAGYSLEAMVKTNCPDVKLKQFSGAMAPICYQTGKMGSVIDYCLHDVHMLKQLVNHIRLNGFLISPKNQTLKILIDF
ncbi:MAG: hypothetical protein EOL93_11130 [Epsilonproteobacteria bacterium]|nr:hypothetical protein [Campylobacterota bacterium]